MEDRRKYNRYETGIKLNISFLYKQEDEVVEDLESDIVVTDLSRGGMGFVTDSDLPVGFYFNADIVLNEEKHFYTVAKIIRKDVVEDQIHYGAEFVGLADILSGYVDEYGEMLKS